MSFVNKIFIERLNLTYLIILSSFLVSYLIISVLIWLVTKQISKTEKKVKKPLLALGIKYLKEIPSYFWLTTTLYFNLHYFLPHHQLTYITYLVFLILLAYQIIIFFFKLIDYFTSILNREETQTAKTSFLIFNYLTKAFLLVTIVLIFFSSLGINISSLVAGLGIGGIAIALAVQNILSDLLSTLAIVLDRTINVGDFIEVGNYQGKVEKIGIKTTRIRSFKGEEIIIPNKELASQVVRNYHSMKKRRISFKIIVTYETSLEKLRKIPIIIKEIIEKKEQVTFKRANLIEMADSGLIFNITYELNSKDYPLYLQNQESIIYDILDKFNQEKIELAYPTQAIIIKKP